MPELIPAAPGTPDDDTEHVHEYHEVSDDPYTCPVDGCWWNNPDFHAGGIYA